MYAAVRRYEGIANDAEAGRLVGETFVPLLQHVPGFIAYYWIDAGDGVMASMSLFENQEGADKSVELAHAWIVVRDALLLHLFELFLKLFHPRLVDGRFLE